MTAIPCKAALTRELPIRYGMPSVTSTLQQTPVGSHVRVSGYVRGDRTIRDRLLSLGLTRGTTLRVVRSAPTGCPIELHVRGMSIVLRRSEASALLVEPSDGAGR